MIINCSRNRAYDIKYVIITTGYYTEQDNINIYIICDYITTDLTFDVFDFKRTVDADSTYVLWANFYIMYKREDS